MRTSTDILISLEEKIEKLVSYSSNQDLLLKTLNNKILKLEKIINDVMKEDVSVAKEVGENPPPPIVVQNNPIQNTVQNGLKKLDIKGLNPEVNFFKKPDGSYVLGKMLEEAKLQAETKPEEVKSEVKSSGMFSRSVPVQQQITYEDGKPASMVSIEIFKNGNIFKKLKTVANGKWNLSLDPGQYKIKLNKKENSTRQEINHEFTVDVPASDRAVILDTLKF